MSVQQPGWRRALWGLFVAALLAGVVILLYLGSWPLPDRAGLTLLGSLATAMLAVEVFTIDFSDKKRISGSYIYALMAASLMHPTAGVWVAGLAGLLSGVARDPKPRTVLFHGARLAAAAGLAGLACVAFVGTSTVDVTWAGVVVVLVYAGVFSVVAWLLGAAEVALAGQPASHSNVDFATNLLLAPLPLVLTFIYERAGSNAIVLAAVGLTLLLMLVRTYINLATLHSTLKEAYARLSRQEERLEEALQANREMSQVVSHDIRGPLTSVMGYTELLQGVLTDTMEDPSRIRRYLESIDRNSRRILTLADRLLDLNRLEQGAEVEMAPCDVARLLNLLLEDCRGRADQKHVELGLQVAGGLPLLMTSEWMLREIVENLLSNGIKYSSAGGRVEVRASIESEQLVLRVADNGIGMSADDQARLFTRFFRSGAAMVQEVSGTGLGLALTRTMVERLSGTISVSSELGKGSCFTVRLPAVAAVSAGTEADTASWPSPAEDRNTSTTEGDGAGTARLVLEEVHAS